MFLFMVVVGGGDGGGGFNTLPKQVIYRSRTTTAAERPRCVAYTTIEEVR